MRQVSLKRAAQQRVRGKLVRRTEPQACERCHREPAVDVHELTRRSQSSTSAIDLDEMVPIGRTCHDWIGLHPDAAEAEGWHRRGMRNLFTSDSVAVMPKVPITLHVTDVAKGWVDEMAERYKVSRALVLRAMLSVATAHAGEVQHKLKEIKDAG